MSTHACELSGNVGGGKQHGHRRCTRGTRISKCNRRRGANHCSSGCEWKNSVLTSAEMEGDGDVQSTAVVNEGVEDKGCSATNGGVATRGVEARREVQGKSQMGGTRTELG
eukprot:3895077-Amphidinium_carterae.1